MATMSHKNNPCKHVGQEIKNGNHYKPMKSCHINNDLENDLWNTSEKHINNLERKNQNLNISHVFGKGKCAAHI